MVDKLSIEHPMSGKTVNLLRFILVIDTSLLLLSSSPPDEEIVSLVNVCKHFGTCPHWIKSIGYMTFWNWN